MLSQVWFSLQLGGKVINGHLAFNYIVWRFELTYSHHASFSWHLDTEVPLKFNFHARRWHIENFSTCSDLLCPSCNFHCFGQILKYLVMDMPRWKTMCCVQNPCPYFTQSHTKCLFTTECSMLPHRV